MELYKNESINKSKWEKFLEENEHASPFQSFSFYDLYNSVSGLSANVYAIEKNNCIEALCVITMQKEKGIKGYFSRRAIIYGGPLLTDQETASLLLEKISSDYKNKAIFIEFRNSFDYSKYRNLFEKFGFRYVPYQNVIIKLSNTDDNFKAINAEKRRQIKRSKENGTILIWNKEAGKVYLNEIYALFKSKYQTKIKKPLPSIDFFKKLIELEECSLLVIKFENKVIGASIVLKDRRTVFDWYRIGDDEKNRKLYPSTLAAWSGIEYGIKNNCLFFDFMGAGIKDEPYPVRDFKMQFGGELLEQGRLLKINNKFLYTLGKLALTMVKRIK